MTIFFPIWLMWVFMCAVGLSLFLRGAYVLERFQEESGPVATLRWERGFLAFVLGAVGYYVSLWGLHVFSVPWFVRVFAAIGTIALLCILWFVGQHLGHKGYLKERYPRSKVVSVARAS